MCKLSARIYRSDPEPQEPTKVSRFSDIQNLLQFDHVECCVPLTLQDVHMLLYNTPSTPPKYITILFCNDPVLYNSFNIMTESLPRTDWLCIHCLTGIGFHQYKAVAVDYHLRSSQQFDILHSCRHCFPCHSAVQITWKLTIHDANRCRHCQARNTPLVVHHIMYMCVGLS